MRETIYPLPGGNIIAELKPGDEIIIKTEFGHPPVENDSAHIIASVDQFSALTADGIMLCCYDGVGVSSTGKHYDKFEISAEAKEILDRVNSEAV